jgi:rRNA-processing protein FCF1
LAKRASLTILFDTNFLLIPSRFGVDIFSELDRLVGGIYQCVVMSAVLDELRRIDGKERRTRAGENDLAVSLSRRCSYLNEPLRHGEIVDDQIVRLSVREGYAVATTDADLRRRLRSRGVPVFYLRQRNHLDLDGAIQS